MQHIPCAQSKLACAFVTAGVLSIVGVLSADLCSVDPLFTKTTLELVERQLRRQAGHLASQLTLLQAPTSPGEAEQLRAWPSGLAWPAQSVELEESSGPSGQYMPAASHLSLDTEEHPNSASSIFNSAGSNNNDHLIESVV